MARTLADLKKRSSSERLSSLAEKLDNQGKKTFEEDNRFWKPTLDASGNSSALIRFLPEPIGEDLSAVELYKHWFKGPSGKIYNENSLTTLGQKDPVSEYNTILWNRGDEDGKKQASSQKRHLNYYSNILVINDPKNPENNGKVFLYRYGVKIMEKLKSAMFPVDDGISVAKPFDPFDLWNGADFKIIAKTLKGKTGEYTSYDSSSFLPTGRVSGTESMSEEEYDDFVDSTWRKCHPLAEIVSPSVFKDYTFLKNKLNDVLELNNTSSVQSSRTHSMEVPQPVVEEVNIPDESPDIDDLDDIAALLADDDDLPY